MKNYWLEKRETGRNPFDYIRGILTDFAVLETSKGFLRGKILGIEVYIYCYSSFKANSTDYIIYDKDSNPIGFVNRISGLWYSWKSDRKFICKSDSLICVIEKIVIEKILGQK
jgi:hypothetical protein